MESWLKLTIIIAILAPLLVVGARRRKGPPSSGDTWAAAFGAAWQGLTQECRRLRWALATVPPERRRPLWLVVLIMAPMAIGIAVIVVVGWK